MYACPFFPYAHACRKRYKLVEYKGMDIIVLLPVLFFSIILHEFAHGYAAYRLGDDTAYMLGRLTLNPLKHVDPVGTLAVPAFCYLTGLPMFGWAKPVPVSVRRLNSPRADMGKVALAGPLTNLVLAGVCVIALKVLIMGSSRLSADTLKTLFYVLRYAITVNVLLAVFNLIPIPPLDGGRILSALLPAQASYKYESFFGRYGMYIVIALILTGGVRYILMPVVTFVMGLFAKFLML